MRRLQNELKKMDLSPVENYSVAPVDNNLYHWAGTIFGPVGTPYEGGMFNIDINITVDYPHKAPKIKFLTRIFHPNISRSGDICVDILKDKWTCALTIDKTLLSIVSLLGDANPNDPLEGDIADLYLNDRDEFNRKARQSTLKYAN